MKRPTDPSGRASTSARRAYVAAGLAGACVLAALSVSAYTAMRVMRGTSPLIDASMEVRVQTSLAHLRLEENLAGDAAVGVEKIRPHLDKAESYVRAMLEGGVLGAGEVAALDDEKVRDEVRNLQRLLVRFRELLGPRLDAGASHGAGTMQGAPTDSLFEQLEAQAVCVEDCLRKTVARDVSRFARLQWALIAGALLLSLLTGMTALAYSRRRDSDMRALQSANQQLDAANQQLSAHEQQLRAVNQQLAAGERALRVSEARYRSEALKAQGYLDVAGVVMVVIDADQRVSLINRKGCAVLDYKEEEVLGKNWFDTFVPERMRKDVKSVFDKLMAGEMENVEYFENPVVARDGRERTLAWHNALLRDDQGAILGTLSSGEDVTDVRRAQEEVQKSQRLESLGVLAGGIAHDFNNLLGGLFGYIDLARGACSMDRTASEYLDKAMAAFSRAKDLTQQLLTFSKGGKPSRKLASLGRLLRDAAHLALAGSRIRCVDLIDADLRHAEIDEGQIAQVVNNIVLNARQAMPEGGTVTVGASNRHVSATDLPALGAGWYVEIRISDDGIGIPEKHLAKVFDPFFTTKQHGSGLGLAVSYSIVKNHGGRIAVESVLGKGTTVTVWLPASEQRAGGASGGTARVPKGSGRVLVMDDEPIVLDMAVAQLKRLGYEAEGVKRGEDAVAAYREASGAGRPYNLVVLDLTVVGGMGGKETVEELRKLDPGVKALVSSGYSDDPIMAEPAAYGFVGKAAKPYRMQDLAEAVRAAMGGAA